MKDEKAKIQTVKKKTTKKYKLNLVQLSNATVLFPISPEGLVEVVQTLALPNIFWSPVYMYMQFSKANQEETEAKQGILSHGVTMTPR